MTELYVLDRGGEPLPEALAESLPSWRRERFERLQNPAVRQESLGAGLLFSFAMRRRGVDPDAPVAFLPAGKPVLSGRDDAHFSLSHAGRYVLCAVSDRPVGADVQPVRSVNLSIARRFHPDEQAWLSALPEDERQAGLFRLWTRKEAWVKAVSRDRMLALDEANVLRDVGGLFFRDYTIAADVPAAVCGAEEPPEAFIPVPMAELLSR